MFFVDRTDNINVCRTKSAKSAVLSLNVCKTSRGRAWSKSVLSAAAAVLLHRGKMCVAREEIFLDSSSFLRFLRTPKIQCAWDKNQNGNNITTRGRTARVDCAQCCCCIDFSYLQRCSTAYQRRNDNGKRLKQTLCNIIIRRAEKKKNRRTFSRGIKRSTFSSRTRV